MSVMQEYSYSVDDLPCTLTTTHNLLIAVTIQAIIIEQKYILVLKVNKKNTQLSIGEGGQDNPAGTGCPPNLQWMKEKWYAYPNWLIAVANQAIIIEQKYILLLKINRRKEQVAPHPISDWKRSDMQIKICK